MPPKKTKSGFSILEGLIALGLASLWVLIIIGQITYGQQLNDRNFKMSRAIDLAQEGIEAIKNIRDADFFDLEDGVFGLKLENGSWQLATTTPEVIDGIYQRDLIISSVDSDTKRLESVVGWNSDRVKITTIFKNWIQTVEDWTILVLEGDFDLTPENSGSNNHDSRTVVVEGDFIFVGNANSNGKEFMIFDITKVPELSILGSLDLSGSPNKMVILGTKAFIASSDNGQELQVVDFSNRSQPNLAASFDLTGSNSGHANADGVAIDLSGSILVMGRSDGDKILIFDVSNPLQPQLLGSTDIFGSPNDLVIDGDYVFVATTDNDNEVQVVDISNPQLPVVVDSINLNQGNDTNDALSVAVNKSGRRLYVGRNSGGSAPEFYVFDLINPSSPLLLNYFDVGDGFYVVHISLSIDGSLAFLVTTEGRSFIVLDVANDLNIAQVSSIVLSGSPKQADYSQLFQRMVIVGRSDPEISIIAPNLIF